MQTALLQKPFFLPFFCRYTDQDDVNGKTMELIRIHDINPQVRLIKKAAILLNQGGVVIYPTDTVYALGCGLAHKGAIERIYRIKDIPRDKPLSILVKDLMMMNDYIRGMSDASFKLLKRITPGPYTFIFQASKMVPRYMLTRQKTVGVRITENIVVKNLIQELDGPIISTSIPVEDENYDVDPDNLQRSLANSVDMIISTGIRRFEPSTIIDCTGEMPMVTREGKGMEKIES